MKNKYNNMSDKLYCSKCGSENKSNDKKCVKCGEYLLKEEYFKKEKKERFKDIFTTKNKQSINQITIESYNNVIHNIIYMGRAHLNNILKVNNINLNSLSILNKIELLAQSYAKLNYKTSGESLGFYAFNSIQIDDRLYDSQQIATLIHELAHHIFCEIVEELLMYVWECDKSDALEAFAWFCITGNPNIQLANEYCAHTCEGRFIPHGYQNYGSFNKILDENFDEEKDAEQIKLSLLLGNTLAHDIIYILEGFIGQSLRDEIKEQFRKDSFPPRYDQIQFETSGIMPDDLKIKIITDILNSGFEAGKEKDMNEVLEEFKNTFTEANKG